MGTLEEYEAQDVANKHPGWICFITDDFTGSSTDLGAILEQINTIGGYDYVVESQSPTSSNGYTWYRKYKSGWVVQGGTAASGSSSVTFPVVFSDTEYYFNADLESGGTGTTLHAISSNYTTTGCAVKEGQSGVAQRALTAKAKWFACGVAA